jgi:DNA 3'-phosphatase
MVWKEIDSILYYIPKNFKYNQALAIFNFVETLVILKYNNIEISLKYKYEEVKSKLKDIANKGASIMIYQSFYHNNINHIKYLFELFIKDLEIPIVAFFSTSKNKYTKPCTNIWNLMELFYQKEKKQINKNLSIFVGHKAGRINLVNKKSIDYSCLDRSFASNIGISFFTPERFFLNDTKVSMWEFTNEIINQESRKTELSNNLKIQVPVIINEIYLLPKSDLYTIIITGPPSCGKTTLAKKFNQKWTIEYKIGKIAHVSENEFELFEEVQISVNQHLKEKKSVIVDLLCNINNITQLIKTSMINHVPILIVEIKGAEKIIKLLDFIKIQNSKSYKSKLYLKQHWIQYYKNYKEPKFTDLSCVKYMTFPLIIQISDEFWYEYSY